MVVVVVRVFVLLVVCLCHALVESSSMQKGGENPSIWREEIQNRNGPPRFGGKKFKIEMDPLDLAGRNSK
jgi:hypothetical protein